MNARLLLLITALAFSGPAWANEFYRVEIIVFVQPDAEALGTELYVPIVPIDTSDSVDFMRYSCQPIGFTGDRDRTFGSEEDVAACLGGYLRLNELSEPMIAERLSLEKNPDYRVLHHIAWRQPAREPQYARAVRLSNTTHTSGEQTGLLNGMATLSFEEFLQLDIELNYLPDSSSSEVAGTTSKNFAQGIVLRTLRKLRPGQLNYVDHPLLGILARVTEVEEAPAGETRQSKNG